MGKNGRNEVRKVVAAFLNGVAVAILVTGLVSPMLANDPRSWVPCFAIVAGLAAHLAAISVVRRLED
jgi:hypothetical protein